MASIPLEQPSKATSSSAEFYREREVSSFLQSWQAAQGSSVNVAQNVDSIGAPDLRDADYKPQASPDRVLSALAQLAVLKLNVKRAMISLIDSTSQTILAEATQKLPLVPLPGDDGTPPATDPDNDLWLGTSVLVREDAVCGHCLTNSYTIVENGTPYTAPGLVIPDCRLDERFSDRAYVVSEPGVRFYAGVPIFSRNGHKIGAYAVSDEKPRDRGLSVEELQFMQSTVQAIMEHLEWARDRVDRFKGERIVRGLATFIEDCSGASEEGTRSEREAPDSSTVRPPELALQSSTSLSRNSSAKSHRSRPSQDNKPRKQSAKSDGLSNMFRQAAEILRDSTLADGAIFFGAEATSRRKTTKQPGQTGAKSGEDHLAPGSSDSEITGILSSDSDVSPVDRPCKVLAYAFAHDQPQPNMERGSALSVGTLDKYFQLFPKGKTFSFTEDGIGMFSGDDSASEADHDGGNISSDSTSSRNRRRKLRMDHEELLKRIPGAKAVVFVPLFDFAEDRLAAGCFLWSSVPGRMINLDQDLSYLRAFGNSITSQVGRIRTQKNEAAKTTFIASMSHELRSPLHGILGAAEFLKDTTRDPYQMGLINSIATCGKTLLDTLNHVLDYSKINRLGRLQLRRNARQAKVAAVSSDSLESMNMTAVVDLSVLVEEVVDAIAAGHVFRMRYSDRGAMPLNSSPDKEASLLKGELKLSSMDEGPVSVLLDITPRASWIVRTQPGALRRIVMNLFGNALKYTSSGFVYVSLDAHETKDKSKIDVLLRVVDTGKGMSEEFQRNRLFLPFSQEDSFQPGTGLGLSIVKQIVDSLAGTLEVKSQVDKGTEFEVRLRLASVANEDGMSSQVDESMQSTAEETKGLQVVMRDANRYHAVHGRQTRKLDAQIANTCSKWFKMKVVKEDSMMNKPADINLYCEPPSMAVLEKTFAEDKQLGLTEKMKPIVIVCLNASEAAEISKTQSNELARFSNIVEIVSQPCGPRKLAKIFSRCLRRTEELNLLQETDGNLFSEGAGGNEGSSIRRRNTLKRIESELQDDDVQEAASKLYAGQGTLDAAAINHVVEIDGSPPPSPPEEDEPIINVRTPPAPKMRPTILRKPVKHVLLVDDNTINLQLLVMFMKKCGYTYEEASNGQEALDRYMDTCGPQSGKKQRFDFVLMDISMPIMNGFESTKRIREFEHDNGLSLTTVVALTGLASEDARRDAMSVGMDMFLPKPVRFADLKKMLSAD